MQKDESAKRYCCKKMLLQKDVVANKNTGTVKHTNNGCQQKAV